MSAQLTQGFQALTHEAPAPFTPPTVAHVIALAAVMRFIHVCGPDGERLAGPTKGQFGAYLNVRAVDRGVHKENEAPWQESRSLDQFAANHELVLTGNDELRYA